MKELKIQIPEGYEIDKENSSFEKIIFKKKNPKPRSWEEYCVQCNTTPIKNWYFIDNASDVRAVGWRQDIPSKMLKNTLPSKELAEAFLAMMQLMSLRQAWIGDWETDWNGTTCHYCIVIEDNEYTVGQFAHYHKNLSFPTKEMAIDFKNCFKDLLEQAKILL